MIIRNKQEIIDELTELLMDFQKEMNSYQTDVYLYYDEDTQTATLDTFVNIGGNSWLGDDHYLLYSDGGYLGDYMTNLFDCYYSTQSIADAIGITEDQLYRETAEYFDYDVDDPIDVSDIRVYVERNDTYYDALVDDHNAEIESYRDDYESEAYDIINDFIHE